MSDDTRRDLRIQQAHTLGRVLRALGNLLDVEAPLEARDLRLVLEALLAASRQTVRYEADVPPEETDA